MPDSPRLVQTGSCLGTPVMTDVTTLHHEQSVWVTLLEPYVTLCPPGYPARVQFTGVAAGNLDYPRTLADESVLLLAKPEADALVNAGFAIYLATAAGILDFQAPAQSAHLLSAGLA